MLFDNNKISIDGPTNLAVSDNFKKDLIVMGGTYRNRRYEKQIFSIKKAQNQTPYGNKKTIIGYGSPNNQKLSAHGSPLGKDGCW